MKNIYIIMTRYYDIDHDNYIIGGVETYIHNLCKIAINMQLKPIVYQKSTHPFEVEKEGTVIRGITARKKYAKKVISLIPHHEVVVFSNDEVVYGKYNGITINIQHGIAWDLQHHQYRGEIMEYLYYFLSLKDNIRRIKYTRLANYVVCVDYNYLNWIRAQCNFIKAKIHVIPNFADVPNSMPTKKTDVINIVFARRFVDFRGTRLFSEAILRIVHDYPCVQIVFAGTGPDEEWLRKQFVDTNNVVFIQYNSVDSIKIHSEMHIAVVPSLGSEGTSLSLLEAMASGCAVVCTNVGGMTNIVLDHYNGLIIEPQVDDVYNAIKELLDSKQLREKLGKNAFETVSNTFSKEKWIKSWEIVLHKALNEVRELN